MGKDFENWLKDHEDKGDIEIIHIDPGRSVFCDLCDKDWTDSKRSGGFLFLSKAICPDCENGYLQSVKSYGEEKYIRGWCPKDVPFADWIRSFRG